MYVCTYFEKEYRLSYILFVRVTHDNTREIVNSVYQNFTAENISDKYKITFAELSSLRSSKRLSKKND